ncbi:hypothetical protein [Gordonia jacobaea]|uniref:hypothetical protein n=1 Tax=Gordonia jacobaea TaxID=122202 RepID=UPI0022E819F2|nr:hypothetical protein [Gordonia jacobaea]
MSEYVDEDGNPVSADEIAKGGYEVVDETTANPEPAPKRKGRGAVAVSAAVIALLAAGGGTAYVLTSSHGDAPAPVAAAPSSSVSSSVAPSSSTPSSSPSSTPGAANGVNSIPMPTSACVLSESDGVGIAQWETGARPPSGALKVVDSVELPSTFTGLASSQKSDALHRVQILQTGPAELGIYWDKRDSALSAPWWKVSVETRTGRPVVAGEGGGAGGDADFAGACKVDFHPGTYRVLGDHIPGGAEAERPGQIALSAVKVDASSLVESSKQVVWAVAGNYLLKTELVRAGSTSAASSSTASTTPGGR